MKKTQQDMRGNEDIYPISIILHNVIPNCHPRDHPRVRKKKVLCVCRANEGNRIVCMYAV